MERCGGNNSPRHKHLNMSEKLGNLFSCMGPGGMKRTHEYNMDANYGIE